MIDIKQLQAEHKEWEEKNFGKQPPTTGFMGMVEEIGELAHAMLKSQQKIRMNENHSAKIIDAVGDIFVYMMGFCNASDLDLETVIMNVWSKVKLRNWKINPETGIIDDKTRYQREYECIFETEGDPEC